MKIIFQRTLLFGCLQEKDTIPPVCVRIRETAEKLPTLKILNFLAKTSRIEHIIDKETIVNSDSEFSDENSMCSYVVIDLTFLLWSWRFTNSDTHW